MVNISLSASNELTSEIIELLEVVGGKCGFERFVAKPFNAIADVINKFLVLFDGVGIIVSKIGKTTIFLSKSEVKSHSLGVTNMKITIWFRWESCHDLAASCLTVLFENFVGVNGQ
jgi:hypothetical protein